jgi:hypothetical protein
MMPPISIRDHRDAGDLANLTARISDPLVNIARFQKILSCECGR